MRVDHGHVGDARERDRSRQRLEEHAAEPIDVGAPVHVVAADLLGRHVVDRPDEMPVGRPPVGDALGQAEVREVHVLATVLAVEQDVRGLDVAVDEPACVRGVERIGDLRAIAIARAGSSGPRSGGAPRGRSPRRTASR